MAGAEAQLAASGKSSGKGSSVGSRQAWLARAGRALDRAVFFSLLGLIVLTAVPYGTVEPWWIALFECAVFVLTACWLVEGWLSGSWHLGDSLILFPLLCLAAFAYIQTLPVLGTDQEAGGITSTLWRAISADPYSTRQFVVKLLAFVLVGQLLMRYVSNKGRVRTLIYVIIGVGVVSAIYGLLRQTMQHTPGFILPHVWPGVGYGQFINRNHFAYLMEMSLGLVLGLIFGGRTSLARTLICVAVGLPMWTALILSNSRGGIFSMSSQVLFVFLIKGFWPGRGSLREPRETVKRQPRVSRSRVLIASCLVVFLLIGVFLVGGDSLVERLESLPGEVGKEAQVTDGGIHRAALWRATWQLIKDHPVTGIGFAGYWVAIPGYDHASGRLMPQQAHNDYLEFAASGGVIGIALAIWFMVMLIARVRRRLLFANNTFSRVASLGALVGLLGVGLHSFVDFGLHITINALVFTGLIAIAIGKGRFDQEPDKGRDLWPRERSAPQVVTRSRA